MNKKLSYSPVGINYVGFDESDLPKGPKGRSGVKKPPTMVFNVVLRWTADKTRK